MEITCQCSGSLDPSLKKNQTQPFVSGQSEENTHHWMDLAPGWLGSPVPHLRESQQPQTSAMSVLLLSQKPPVIPFCRLG